jgi:putative two-component system response regulator
MNEEHTDEAGLIEEVEDLEEIEESDAAASPEQIYQDLVKENSVQFWTKNYEESALPLLLVDKNLIVVWSNLKFQELYGETRNFIGLNITHFYSDSFNEEKRVRLVKSLKSEEATHSWRGQVEKKGRDGLSILCNLLVLPIFRSPQTLRDPFAYIVILDDVSSEHRKLLRGTFTSLLEASQLKDNDTGNHIKRVNAYSRCLAEMISEEADYPEVDREFLENLGYLAAMHDVGKIGTSDNILNKEGPLDDWEWEIMKEHTINGAFILSTYPNSMAREIALFHHERWDGAGYPYGVSEKMIPLCARIVAIADVYDALRMERSYKDSHSHEATLEIMATEEKDHFDPELITAFKNSHETFHSIYKELRD